MSQEFEQRRKERLRRQRAERERVRKLGKLFMVLLAVLVVLVVILSIRQCSRNAKKNAQQQAAVTATQAAATQAPKATAAPTPAPVGYGSIPAPEKGSNSLLDVIAHSGQTHHVYLTFDGGPDPNVTPRILDVLRRYNIKATFFVVGKEIEQYPYLCVRITDEGHLVVPQSYSGDVDKLYAGKTEFMDEVDKTYKLITTNTVSAMDPFKLYRFPGGVSNSSVMNFTPYKDELAANGYYYCDANASIGDDKNSRTSEELVKYFNDYRPKLNNLIIRMNNTGSNEATPDALETIIKTLSDEGYIFSRLDEIEFGSGSSDTDTDTDTETASAAPTAAPTTSPAPAAGGTSSTGSTSNSGSGTSNSSGSKGSSGSTSNSGGSTSNKGSTGGTSSTGSTAPKATTAPAPTKDPDVLTPE